MQASHSMRTAALRTCRCQAYVNDTMFCTEQGGKLWEQCLSFFLVCGRPDMRM